MNAKLRLMTSVLTLAFAVSAFARNDLVEMREKIEQAHAFCSEILSGKTPGEPPVFAPVWIEGETFTVKCKNQTKGTK